MLNRIKHSLRVGNGKVIALIRKVNIFKRLIISFTSLLFATAAFIIFFSFHQYSKEVELNMQRYVSFLVQIVSIKMENRFSGYEANALDFYSDSQVIQALKENASLPPPDDRSPQERQVYEKNQSIIQNKLYNIRHNQKDVINTQFVTPKEQYYMVDPYGYRRGGVIKNLEEFYKTPYYTVPQDKYGYPVWFDTHAQSQCFYKSEQSLYGFSNTVTLGISVYAPWTKDFLGVLIFNIDLNAFSDIMQGYDSYNEGNTFLVGSDGLIAAFDPSLSAPAFPKQPDLYQALMQQNHGFSQILVSGRKIYLSYQNINGTDFFIAHMADKMHMLAPIYRIRNLCILILFILMLVSLLVSYYVTVSISQPVDQLVHVMKKTGEGKWDIRFGNSGRDEITYLGDRFNEMAEKTNQLIHRVYLSEIRQKEASISQKNAQLDALQMQINPHFLYNTLDIIRWEAMYEANGESPVTQMIEKFSQLYRMGMKAGGNTISLQESMDHAKTYLDVINFRHQDKIGLQIQVEGLDPESVFIPQFTLQPMMENAVVHGFLDASQGCQIQIRAWREGEILRISVEDNGSGMEEEEAQRLSRSLGSEDFEGSSIGLRNVNQRIRLFYGNAFGIRIESQKGQGTAIQVALPLRTCSEDMEKGRERSFS